MTSRAGVASESLGAGRAKDRIPLLCIDQPSGPPKYAGVFSASSPGLIDPRDGNLWLGAGIVLVVVSVSVAVWSRLMLGRNASLPD
jgi:hypothetical protein